MDLTEQRIGTSGLPVASMGFGRLPCGNPRLAAARRLWQTDRE